MHRLSDFNRQVFSITRLRTLAFLSKDRGFYLIDRRVDGYLPGRSGKGAIAKIPIRTSTGANKRTLPNQSEATVR